MRKSNTSLSAGERILRVMSIDESRTVDSLRKSLRLSRQDVEEAVHDVGGLDLMVAIGSLGGHSDLPLSEWTIERYE